MEQFFEHSDLGLGTLTFQKGPGDHPLLDWKNSRHRDPVFHYFEHI